ncbi:hypothetical protein MTF65_13615 [Streptomyces sp. APSN-46.1]|uniref:hypothetical protein n=1 Tax=Streptomyces sp. APSN-46.1 TaxID=2929049 RepID=UPI001FB50DC7|nr:hypothetical protein [Streptomyces sp. APSN-46.1]MCJ1678368.1 hypothetical protein [Streptomyces sp. APSN-46.1]
MPSAAHPMANPGFGKREAPGQLARTAEDFGHLTKCEAAFAAFIDWLPEGAAMDHKTLAAHIPGIGQAGTRGVLQNLTVAGHLRRLKERVVREGSSRWVTRTYFSRTVRNDDWWRAYCRSVGARLVPVAAGPGEGTEAPAPGDDMGAAEVPPVEETTAYRTLAKLKEADPDAILSAADCASLTPLAAEWLERGCDVGQLTHALTAGLPKPLHNPAALIRKRLEDKMPPKPTPAPETVEQSLLMCMFCEETEQTSKIVNGLCEECLEGDGDDSAVPNDEDWEKILSAISISDWPRVHPDQPAEAEVPALADGLRAAAGLPPKRRA